MAIPLDSTEIRLFKKEDALYFFLPSALFEVEVSGAFYRCYILPVLLDIATPLLFAFHCNGYVGFCWHGSKSFRV